MAERKIGDLWRATIIGLFLITIFSGFFIEADQITGVTSGLGADLERLDNTSSADYSVVEKQLEDDTFNLSTFTVRENQYIDTRGTAQDFTISKDTTNVNQGFLVNVGNLLKIPVIMTLLISLLVYVSVELFLRFFRPGGV